MSVLESKGSNPRERFELRHIVHLPDGDSFIAVARHVRTGSPVDATISSQQLFYGLLVCLGLDNALWCLEQLKEHNLIEPKAEGAPLLVSPNELVQFGFKKDDVCRIVERADGNCERAI